MQSKFAKREGILNSLLPGCIIGFLPTLTPVYPTNCRPEMKFKIQLNRGVIESIQKLRYNR